MSTGGDGTEVPIDLIGKTADQINTERESQNRTAKVMFAATVVSMAKSTQDADFQRWADMIVSDLTSKGMVPELLMMVASMATQQQQVAQQKPDPSKDRRAATEDIRMKVQQTIAERAAANASARQVSQQMVAVIPQIISLITELNSNGRIKAVDATTAAASDPAASPADSSTSAAPAA